MAMSVGGSGKKTMSEINITPFTDVCLVLLIIFMVSTTFGHPKGRDVKLPQASRKATNNLPQKDITITLAKNGALYIDNDQVKYSDLFGQLQDRAKKVQVKNVVIKADQGMQYDQVVKAMDAVRESGITFMSLAVEQPSEKLHQT
jgi:biopolymer transport protein TolR